MTFHLICLYPKASGHRLIRPFTPFPLFPRSTNRSYDAYIEGRKLVSTIVNNLRTAIMDMVCNAVDLIHSASASASFFPQSHRPSRLIDRSTDAHKQKHTQTSKSSVVSTSTTPRTGAPRRAGSWWSWRRIFGARPTSSTPSSGAFCVCVCVFVLFGRKIEEGGRGESGRVRMYERECVCVCTP